MTEREIDNEYFEWMCGIVCDDFEDMPSYTKLLKHLHNKEYTYVIDMDGNRAQDGLDLRRHFAFEDDYSPAIVTKALINRPCMVLEMMVALAARCEVTIGNDIRYGDRTHIWFWNMIKSLGLTSMNDARYNKGEVDDILDKFMHNDYEPDGKGGLFTIENCREDLRNVELWAQMNWYMSTVLEDYEW